jgi:hypothetical protein
MIKSGSPLVGLPSVIKGPIARWPVFTTSYTVLGWSVALRHPHGVAFRWVLIRFLYARRSEIHRLRHPPLTQVAIAHLWVYRARPKSGTAHGNSWKRSPRIELRQRGQAVENPILCRRINVNRSPELALKR